MGNRASAFNSVDSRLSRSAPETNATGDSTKGSKQTLDFMAKPRVKIRDTVKGAAHCRATCAVGLVRAGTTHHGPLSRGDRWPNAHAHAGANGGTERPKLPAARHVNPAAKSIGKNLAPELTPSHATCQNHPSHRADATAERLYVPTVGQNHSLHHRTK